MSNKKITTNTIHKTPTDLEEIFLSHHQMFESWNSITPLARNEWICWIESAKKLETRNRRIKIMCENLVAGKRRPCCWIGCVHR